MIHGFRICLFPPWFAYFPGKICFRDGLILHTCEREGPSHWLVPIEHLFGTFFAQSRAQLGAAIARGMALRALGTSSMGLSRWQSVSPAHCTRARPSLRVRIFWQGTPNGVMLLPPEACIFSSFMCLLSFQKYCLLYSAIFLLFGLRVPTKYLIQTFFILTRNKSLSTFRLQASGFRDGLILHTCER
jgi:hypothetical protein